MDLKNANLLPTPMLSPATVEREYGPGFSIIRLREWRLRGGGPRHYKIGRSVFYRVNDLEAFIAAAAVEPRPRETRSTPLDLATFDGFGPAIVAAIGATLGTGRLTQDVDGIAARLERELAPCTRALVLQLADPRPFGGLPDDRSIRDLPGGALAFTVVVPGARPVSVVYDPRTGRTSSQAGAPWLTGLVGLFAHVFGLREGRPLGRVDVVERMLALWASSELETAAAPSVAPTLDDLAEGCAA